VVAEEQQLRVITVEMEALVVQVAEDLVLITK
jgi:hypothetical protein